MPERRVLDLDWYDRVARSGCFVCEIVAGRPPLPGNRVVYEDDQTIAFLNALPPQVGYTLVCPKQHVERYEADLSGEEWRHLQSVVHAVSGAVARATGAIRVYIACLGSPERNPTFTCTSVRAHRERRSSSSSSRR